MPISSGSALSVRDTVSLSDLRSADLSIAVFGKAVHKSDHAGIFIYRRSFFHKILQLRHQSCVPGIPFPQYDTCLDHRTSFSRWISGNGALEYSRMFQQDILHLRGADAVSEGIRYLNAEEYLKSL